MEKERGNEEEKKEHSKKKKKNKKERKKNKSRKELNGDENIWLCPMISTVGMKFDLSNDFMSKEFVEFLYNEGVDVDLMDSERVRDLKRKYGEVEICRSEYEYKQAKLCTKLEKLKCQHYQTALQKFS